MKPLTQEEFKEEIRKLILKAPTEYDVFVSITWREDDDMINGFTAGKGCPKCAVERIKMFDEKGTYTHAPTDTTVH